MKKLILFLLAIAFLFQSCKYKTEKEIEIEQYTEVKNRIDSQTELMKWRKLNCGLWINKDGDIGFKDYKVIGMEGLISVEYFITKMGFNEEEPLKKIIDTLTFQELGSVYYKDKNHIYRFYGMAGGGSFYFFEEADYETFEVLGDCYAKDKNNIYEMRSGKLENVDYKTFKAAKNNSVGCVAKDKNGYLSWGDRINPNEIDDEYIKKAIEELEKE